ncbi:MAG TPA: tail fiber protein [Fimbriimonadaceae bacterium]|jgi:microcystin-dependent protein
MSDQFVGEIRPFPFNFAPTGWAMCQGQIMSISQNTALFSLLGTYYGGDGKSTFALPNLQGNVAINQGQSPGEQQYTIGETAGAATVALTLSQMPAHNHRVNARATQGTSSHPTGNMFAEAEYHVPEPFYDSTSSATLSGAALVPYGSNAAHTNLQPYLVINYCIALQGIFPPRS